MKKNIIYFLFLFFLVFFSNSGFAQKDTLFWFSAPETNRYHTQMPDPCVELRNGAPVYIHLTTFNEPTIVTISMPANPLFNGGNPIVIAIPANTTHREDLTSYIADTSVNQWSSIENRLRWTTSDLAAAEPYINRNDKGIKISSEEMITAYYEIGVIYNMELISLKGNNALGRQFYVPFQNTNNTRPYNCDYRPYSSIDIVATEDNTKILIYPNQPIWIKDGSVPSLPAGGPYELWLNKGETSIITPYQNNPGVEYQTSFSANARLAGTFVEVDTLDPSSSGAPITIITHDDVVKTNYPIGNLYGNPDYVADQIVPIDHIGTDYAIIQGIGFDITEIEDYIYIVGTEPNTNITIKCDPAGYTETDVVGVGETRAFSMNNSDYEIVTVKTDLPVYVFHMSGAGRQKAGALIPTISTCTGSYDVAFNRTLGGDYNFYLTILARNSAIGNFTLTKDGALTVDEQGVLDLINNPASFNPLPETGAPYNEWQYARINANDLDNGIAYLISNDTELFHLGVLNGNTTYDAFYGYFSNFNEMQANAIVTTEGGPIGIVCPGDTAWLEASGGRFYTWSPTVYLNDPFARKTYAILPPGIHTYQVRVQGACNLDETITLQIDAQETPNAFFQLSKYTGCAPFTAEIINKSDSAYIYKWDYTNDGSWDEDTYDSTVTPASFTYNNTTSTDTTYTIRMLTRYDGSVCSDEFKTTVHIKPEINADFTLTNLDDTIGCNPLEVNFTDLSSTNTVNEYQWVFDDGEASITTGDVTHEFSHTNANDTVEFDVELRLTSPYYCRDTARQTISVFPYIEGEFTIDKDYGCSPLDVTFTNVSKGDIIDTLIYGDGTPSYAGTSFGSLTHTYVNTGDTVAHFPVELKAFNVGGCLKIWRDTIIVYPEVEADFTVDTARVCNTGAIEFNRTSAHGKHIASNFLWNFGDGANSNTDSTITIFNKTYTNTTNSDRTYTARLIAKSQYGCSDTTYRDILAYRALADFVLDESEGCSPLEVNVNNQSKGTGIDYLWEFDNGSLPSSDQNPTNPIIYNNTSDTVSEHYFSLTVASTDGLCSTSQTDTITVYPEIHIDNINITPLSAEVCDSTNVTLEADILHAGLPDVSYTWGFDDGASANTNPATNLFRNINQAGFVVRNVQLNVETQYGCTDSTLVNVTVHPRVRAFFTMDASSGCSPDTITVTPIYYPGISEYEWDFDGDGTPEITTSDADPQTHVFPRNTSITNTPDIYSVTLTVSNGNTACNKVFSRIDTVFAEAKANFAPMDSIGCNPFEFIFRDYSINANQYTWDFNDGTTSSVTEPKHQFINTTSGIKPYDVNLEVTTINGCTHDTTGLVEVYPYTNAAFDIDLSEDCSPLTVNISNNSSGTEFYWFWDDDNLNLGNADSTITASSITKTYYNSSGVSRTDSLTLIVGNGHGCYDTLKRGVTIHSSIVADFTFVQNDACNPSDVVFTNESAGGGSYTMNWNFGDGSSLTTSADTINKTFTNNTINDKTYTVVMTAESENGCTDLHTDYITVYSKVIADYSIEENEGCPAFTANIQNTSIGNAANTYQWLVDGIPEGPTNKDDFTHTYENNTTSLRPYQVRLVAENAHGCMSEYIDTVTVYEYVEASYAMDYDAGCNPLDIQFTDLSTVPVSTKYTYNFGDGATSGSEEPLHRFYNSSRETDKSFSIKLTVQSSNFCTDDTIQDIWVYHQPLAKLFIDNTSSCPPLVSFMENESVGEDMFEWRFGDGTFNTTDVTTTHTYPNTIIDSVQNYTLELWVATNEGCKDSTSLELNVFPDVTADFTYDESGCSPFVSSFINESTSPAEYFYWNFDDGNTSNQENPVHRFTNTWNTDRTYNVFLRASSEYNCWDTITKQVTAYVQPIVAFDASPVVMKFPDNRVLIDNFTNDGPFDYLWEFGDLDETTSAEVEPNYFDYEHWGEKNITQTVTSQTSDCNDALTKTITILPPDINADFTTSVDGGCLDDGLDVDFVAAASIYSEVYEYTWDFGDGETAEGAEITHTYTEPGTYNVKLTAIGEGGADFEYKTIRVYSNPEAKFELLPSVSMLDAETLQARVEFYNQSICNDTSGCAYLWDFGDGNTSIATNVSHYYQKPPNDEIPKDYDIKLLVTNSQGCVDSLIKERAVKIIGEGEIAFPNAFTPNEDGINDVFKPVYKGVVKYELLIYNRWGELIFETNNIEMGWNGKVGGTDAKPDVYVWKAEGRFTNGRAFELAGDVTLIR